MSDGKLGHLSTAPNNNISDFIPASYIFFCVKMLVFEPKKHHLREVLLYFFDMKKSAVASHRLLVEAYGEAALSETTCRDWFRRFKSGDFDMEDKERTGRPKLVEDAELEALLDEDLYKMQEELAESLRLVRSTVSMRLKALGMIQKQGNLVPYETKKPRNLAFFHM